MSRSLHPERGIIEAVQAYVQHLGAFVQREGVYPLSYLLVPLVLVFTLRDWTVRAVLLGVPLALVACALYLPSYWLSKAKLRQLLAFQSGFAVLSSFLLPSAVWLHLLPVFASSRQVGRRSVALTLIILMSVASLNWWTLLTQENDVSGWWLMPFLGTFLGWASHFEVSRERTNARLKLAEAESRRLGASAERERIARDLHDLLGQSLSLIAVKAELTKKLAPNNLERALRENDDVVRIAKNTLAEVRQAVTSYRAPTLEDELVNADLALRSVGVVLSVSLQPVNLTDDQEAALAFMLREAVTNVVRHAEASRCEVVLSASPTAVTLSVTDNGRGGLGAEGGGLQGIRSRAEALGGTFERPAGPGTRLVVRLPLAVARRGSRAVA